VTEGGAEKVLKELVELFPQADIYTIVDFLNEVQRLKILRGKRSHTSFIQHLPFARNHFRYYLPLMPRAIRSFDLSHYDLVISSSWAFAKGVKARRHLCYCHTPIRYAWDLFDEYTAHLPPIKRELVRWSLKHIRSWDKSHLPDLFIANSTEVANRIKRIYQQDSTIVHPPVDLERFQLREDKEGYYFTLSRLVPYKKTRLLVEAFNQMPQRHLVVAGEGEELEAIRAIAGPNVEVLGYVEDCKAVELMQRARAFLYAGYEDFGIVMAEALACGTPVIAYGRGGALDIVDRESGILFARQDPRDVMEAIERFEQSQFEPRRIRQRALCFDRHLFRQKIARIVDAFLQAH